MINEEGNAYTNPFRLECGPSVSAIFDLLGRPLAIDVLWTLSNKGDFTTDNISSYQTYHDRRSVRKRLSELREAKILVKDGDVYKLSSIGWELCGLMLPLTSWTRKWGFELVNSESK